MRRFKDLFIAIFFIALYYFGTITCDNIKCNIGGYRTLAVIFNAILFVFLYFYMTRTKGKEYYNMGLTIHTAKSYLFFIPLIIISTANLWNGVGLFNRFDRLFFYIAIWGLMAINEELLFRGLLIKQLEKVSDLFAVIVCGLVFGLMHYLNLISVFDMVTTTCQVIYAGSLGILFSVIVVKGKSILPGIYTHVAFNCLVIFMKSMYVPKVFYFLSTVLISSIALLYAIYLWYNLDEYNLREKFKEDEDMEDVDCDYDEDSDLEYFEI
ncbi:MAG: CPBP family intramembrane metalloprotease [Clostridia bacterium]|nr:CPBP family intramembrane metalloprotease [Clostridia bacterium]